MPADPNLIPATQVRTVLGFPMDSKNRCEVCGNDIHLMCRTGTGVCSENCEKNYALKKPSDA